jgi:hypothetical protein
MHPVNIYLVKIHLYCLISFSNILIKILNILKSNSCKNAINFWVQNLSRITEHTFKREELLLQIKPQKGVFWMILSSLNLTSKIMQISNWVILTAANIKCIKYILCIPFQKDIQYHLTCSYWCKPHKDRELSSVIAFSLQLVLIMFE